MQSGGRQAHELQHVQSRPTWYHLDRELTMSLADLKSRHQAYLVRNSVAHPRPVYLAHRAVRNAAVVSAVFGVGDIEIYNVLERIDEMLFEHERKLDELDAPAREAPPPVIDPADVPVLLDVASQVRNALREALDDHCQPRGPLGQHILDDIESNGELAEFERFSDGTVNLKHPRMSVNDMMLVLDDVVVALEEAIDRGLEVAMLPDPGYPVSYYGLTPQERR